MKLEYMRASAAEFFSQRNLALVAAGIMAFSNLVLVTAYIFKGERTILVPPQLTRSFWFDGGDVSKEYLEEMGLFMSTLLLDMSPSSAQFKHQAILKYAVPESYGSLKNKLLKDEDYYNELQLSTTFRPAQVIADPQNLTASVKGTLTSYMGTDKIHNEEINLQLNFALRGVGLLLEEVKGGPSHER